MSAVIYSVTRRDIRDAILLAQIMGSNPTDSLWCGDSVEHKPSLCGHYGDWQCAADAIGAAVEAADLVCAVSNDVVEAWSHEESRTELAIDVLAPRREGPSLFDDNLEAECLLRSGWLPPNYRICRRRHPDHGEIIPLSWEDIVQAYYVRGHVSRQAFYAALLAYHGADGLTRRKITEKLTTRHAHAWWAFDGSDVYGEPKRTLRECSGLARGAFDVTVLDIEEPTP